MARGKKGDLQHDNTRNELTDDQIYALTIQHKKKYEAALAEKKRTAAELLSITKLIKSELGDSGLQDIKDLIASEGDGFDEKFQAELERKARLAKWLGLSVGEQADLFDFGAVKPGVAERAFEDGKRAGLAGEECKPPFDGGSEGHQKYVEGWHRGQESLLAMIKKKDVEETPLIVSGDNADNGVDEFDDAASDEDDDIDERWPDDREPAEAL